MYKTVFVLRHGTSTRVACTYMYWDTPCILLDRPLILNLVLNLVAVYNYRLVHAVTVSPGERLEAPIIEIKGVEYQVFKIYTRTCYILCVATRQPTSPLILLGLGTANLVLSLYFFNTCTVFYY
jgi:hypothetical protein